MNDELMTDDEALRIAGMTDGPRNVGKFKLRPLCAETLAWAQTVGIFEDDIGNMHRRAGYAMLHTLPPAEILSLVFKKEQFWMRVSKWIADEITHHSQLTIYDDEMNDAYERYDAAVTTAANANTPGIPQAKN